MSWLSDVATAVKNAWQMDLPLAGTGTPYGAASGKALASSALGTAASLPLLYGAGQLPFVKEWFKPMAPGLANGAVSTMTDRPRPSMLDAIAPGTRHRNVYGGYTRGKSVGTVLKETALRETLKQARAYGKKRAGRGKGRAKKSRPRATSSQKSSRSKAPRSRKSFSPKQLAAQRRFAAMARARRKR